MTFLAEATNRGNIDVDNWQVTLMTNEDRNRNYNIVSQHKTTLSSILKVKSFKGDTVVLNKTSRNEVESLDTF